MTLNRQKDEPNIKLCPNEENPTDRKRKEAVRA
jgi:hypothetical protein